MNQEQIKGSWNELKGRVKEQWGKLTDDDLTSIEGKRDILVGKLQRRYGYMKDQAEKEVNDFFDRPSAPRRASIASEQPDSDDSGLLE